MKRLTGSVVVTACVMFAFGAVCAPSKAPEVDPLVMSDVIVKGKIARVDVLELEPTRWFSRPEMHSQDLVTVAMVVIENPSWRRGTGNDTEAEFLFKYDGVEEWATMLLSSLRPGVEVLLCAELVDRHGELTLRFGIGDAYARSEGRWQRCEAEGWSDVFTDDALDARLNDLSVEHVARTSDIAVVGTITAVRSNGDEGVISYDIDVEQALRGRVAADITVSVAQGVHDDWRLTVPFRLKVGERWYLLLSESDDGYSPAAGPRGLFLVRDGQLMENRVVPAAIEEASLRLIVKQSASE